MEHSTKIIIKITVLVVLLLQAAISNSYDKSNNFQDYTDYFYDDLDDDLGIYKTVKTGDILRLECAGHCRHPYWLHWGYTWKSNDSILQINNVTKSNGGFYSCTNGPYGLTCKDYFVIITPGDSTKPSGVVPSLLSASRQVDQKKNDSKVIWRKVEQIEKNDTKVAFDAAEYGFRKVFDWFHNKDAMNKKKHHGGYLLRSSAKSSNSKWCLVSVVLLLMYSMT